MGCSRLPELENGAWQYCSLSVDLLPWSQLAENRRAMWPTFEVCTMPPPILVAGVVLFKKISIPPPWMVFGLYPPPLLKFQPSFILSF